jgi:hypothetical protein
MENRTVERQRERERERERERQRERYEAGESKSHVQGIRAFTLHLWLLASENQKE